MRRLIPTAATLMISDDQDIWYRLGYALERVREVPSSVPGLETLEGLGGASTGERSGGRKGRARSGDGGAENPDNLPARLLDQGVRALGNRVLAALPSRSRTRLLDFLAAAVSGVAATVLAEVVGTLLSSAKELPPEADELALTLSGGVGRGLAYAGVVEPRIPGPAFVAGFLYGTAEYMTASWGGIPSLLGSAAPHRKVPLLSEILEADDRAGDPYLEHLIFGLALALLYDSLRPKRGTTDEE